MIDVNQYSNMNWDFVSKAIFEFVDILKIRDKEESREVTTALSCIFAHGQDVTIINYDW